MLLKRVNPVWLSEKLDEKAFAIGFRDCLDVSSRRRAIVVFLITQTSLSLAVLEQNYDVIRATSSRRCGTV